MFQVGLDKVWFEIMSVIECVVQEVYCVQGVVLIIGYIDFMLINKSGFFNNQVFFEKCVVNVVCFMEKVGILIDKIQFEGKGDMQLVSSNDDVVGCL